MNTTSENITQVILVGLLAGLLMATFAWRSSRLVSKLFLGLVAGCFLAPSAILFVGQNPWIVDARYRTFQIFYWNIRNGMSREDVIKEMQQKYPPDQPRMAPRIAEDSATKLEFQMNPESESTNEHEGIVLKMQDGRVMGKTYEAD